LKTSAPRAASEVGFCKPNALLSLRKRRVSHISLVFREMWDTTALNQPVFDPAVAVKGSGAQIPIQPKRMKMWNATFLPARAREWATILLLLFSNAPYSAAQIPGAAIPPQPPTTVTKTADGLTANIGNETLHVAVCGESVIHVTASPKPLSESVHDQPWMLDPQQACPGAPFQFNQTGDASTLTTRTLKVTVAAARD
jgi:hypothetical protein